MQLMRKAADHCRFEEYVKGLMADICSPLPIYQKYNSNDAWELLGAYNCPVLWL